MSYILKHYQKLSYDECKNLLLEGQYDFYDNGIPQQRLHMRSRKLSQYAHFILVLQNGKTVGCVAYYLNSENSFVYVSYLWVCKTMRRKGIGKLIIDEIISLYKKEYKQILLEVTISRPAYSFYKKNGFIPVEYRENNQRLLMSKSINYNYD